MALIDTLKSRLVDWLFGTDDRYFQRANTIIERRGYRMGMQRQYLRPNRDGYNDNQISNFVALIAERSVSMLFGKSVEFDFGEQDGEGEGQTPIKDYIDGVWELNRKAELLQRIGKNGVESGMCFVKIVPRPDGTIKLVSLDSSLMDIVTNPYDMDDITEYIYQYKSADANGKEMAIREVTKANKDANGMPVSWEVQLYENSHGTGDRWEMTGSTIWEYDFSPIIHWQNLVNIGDAWGQPDITEALVGLQDQYNFNASNRNKIIRYFAHPFRWSKMMGGANPRPAVVEDGRSKRQKGEVESNADKILNFENPDGGIYQLEGLGDLPAILMHLQDLRASMFDTTRTVDISTIKDRLGQLTNFGVKMLYQDAVAKNELKKELYGWGLKEINRRLLALANIPDTPCELVWPNPLPENELEEMQVLTGDINMGIVSKQTVSELRGYDYATEKERKDEEETEQANIGVQALRNFDRGQQLAPFFPNRQEVEEVQPNV